MLRTLIGHWRQGFK